MELKHILSYSPDLKIQWIDGLIRTVNPLIREVDYENSESPIDIVFDGVKDGFAKLILRPLSDLTKEIEHNGERFVPIVLLEDYIDFQYGYERIEYWKIQQLFEWKFDIFNLIEKGEAIDVNTLQTNPYK